MRACSVVVSAIELDEVIWGEVTRISPERPFRGGSCRESVHRAGQRMCGANSRPVGARARIVGRVGDEGRPALRRRCVRDAQRRLMKDVTDSSRPYTVKTRIIAPIKLSSAMIARGVTLDAQRRSQHRRPAKRVKGERFRRL